MTETTDVKGELIKCPRCGYKWDYTGKSNRIHCRRCGKWFQRKYPKKLEVKGELIKCPRCGYKWDYTGKANKIKCGKCGRYFQLKYSKGTYTTEIKNTGIKGEPVECPKCGHKWDYTGKSNRLQCPKCGKWFQRKYPKITYTTKIRNKGLSEKTLAFLGNEFNPVEDRKFLMDNIAIVLGDELTKKVKNASKTKKMTEINLVRLAVKKYLYGGE